MTESTTWTPDGAGALWLCLGGQRIGPHIVWFDGDATLYWGGVAGGGRGRAKVLTDPEQAIEQAWPLIRCWWAEYRALADTALATEPPDTGEG